MNDLVRFLERILPFQNRQCEMGLSFECSEDNYKLLIYEMYLYVVAALIAARRFTDARSLFDHTYVAPETLNGERLKSYSFSPFNKYAKSLEGKCADRGNSRPLSVMADLVRDRANRRVIASRRDLLPCGKQNRTPLRVVPTNARLLQPIRSDRTVRTCHNRLRICSVERACWNRYSARPSPTHRLRTDDENLA